MLQDAWNTKNGLGLTGTEKAVNTIKEIIRKGKNLVFKKDCILLI